MRHLFSTTLFATWAILIAACTQPAGETIINENTKVYEDGSVYVGDLSDGKRHGQGTHLPFEGDRYKGEWANDQKSGQGRLIYKDGSIYEGAFLSDVPEGQGVRTFESEAFGYKYSGTFAAGKQAGRGEEQKRNGKVIEIYKGEFQDGKRNGKGTLTRKVPGLKDFKFVGDFKGGVPHGQGNMVNHDQSTYSGPFKIACHTVLVARKLSQMVTPTRVIGCGA